MRSFILITIFAFSISCTKTGTTNNNQNNNTNNNTNTTTTGSTSGRDYNKPSHDLQTTSVVTDITTIRRMATQKGGSEIAVCFPDINADGVDDIYIIPIYGSNSTERSNAEMYISTGPTYTFNNSFMTTVPSLIHARKAIMGDYNKDGRADIFVTGHGWDQPPYPGEYTVLLLSQNGKYNLQEFKDKVGFYHGTCSGDIDNDGDLDIFVLGNTKSYFLINNGKGNFSYSTSQVDITKLLSQYHCELVDLDKDGFLDLIMGGHEYDVNDTTFKNGVNGSTRIYWGSNSGKFDFTNLTHVPVVDNWGVVTDLDVADIDGDGKNELVVTRTGGKASTTNVLYFYYGWYVQVVQIDNRKATDATNKFISGNVSSAGYSTPNSWIQWLHFQDYDKNGKLDLYSTQLFQSPVVRWEVESGKLVRRN